MFHRICFLFCIAFTFLLACNKEEVILKPVSSSNRSEVLDNSKGWYGLYNYYYQSPDDTTYHTLSDKYIIANGEARVPRIQDVSGTLVRYDIPSSHSIPGDSTTFNLALRDSSQQVVFNLIGGINQTSFNYFAYRDTGYYLVALGSVVKQVKLFPVTDFSTFQLVQFLFKQNKLSVHVGTKLIASFSYTSKDKMGYLKQISLGNSGYIESNYVRLFNSFSQKEIMHDEFNVDGQSRTIFN